MALARCAATAHACPTASRYGDGCTQGQTAPWAWVIADKVSGQDNARRCAERGVRHGDADGLRTGLGKQRRGMLREKHEMYGRRLNERRQTEITDGTGVAVVAVRRLSGQFCVMGRSYSRLVKVRGFHEADRHERQQQHPRDDDPVSLLPFHSGANLAVSQRRLKDSGLKKANGPREVSAWAEFMSPRPGASRRISRTPDRHPKRGTHPVLSKTAQRSTPPPPTLSEKKI